MKQRLAWLDAVRICAILLVVLCHVVETEFYAVRMGTATCSNRSWLLQNTLFTMGRLGVPLFLMITGTLMLGREYNIARFYKKSFLPLAMVTAVWIIINYSIKYLIGDIEFSKKNLVYELLLFRGLEFSHMWYMPMILGIYLTLPFVSKLIESFSGRELAVPLLVAVGAFFGVPFFNTFAGQVFERVPAISLQLNTSFLGGTYGVYLIAGYFVTHRPQYLARIRSIWIAVIGGGAFVINSFLEFYLFSHQLFKSDTLVWYTSPGILLSSVCAFELMRRLFGDRKSGHASKSEALSATAFAVYLMHNIFLTVFIKYFEPAIRVGMPQLLRFFIRYMAAYVPAVTIALMIRRLPWKVMKKYLFYIK